MGGGEIWKEIRNQKLEEILLKTRVTTVNIFPFFFFFFEQMYNKNSKWLRNLLANNLNNNNKWMIRVNSN